MNGQHDFSAELSLADLQKKEDAGWDMLAKCTKCGCYRISQILGETVYKEAFQWNPFKVWKEPPPCNG